MAEYISLEQVLPSERARLVRLCSRLSGDPDAAEDLAQETIIEAWRLRARLIDPSGYAPWLSAIARNMCLRWARRTGRELARTIPTSISDTGLPSLVEELPDTFDLELDLERSELANLLDRALALLPPDTREVLVARFVEETPLHEVATRLGLSQNAVAVRVHRGKLALRTLLNTDLRDEAASFGLGATIREQQTSIWCPLCGQQRLRGRFDPALGQLILRCGHCCTPSEPSIVNAQLPHILKSVTSIRTALSRMIVWSATFYLAALDGQAVACMHCGHPVQMTYVKKPLCSSDLQHEHSLYFACDSCGDRSWTLVGALGLFLPEGRRFWQAHPRIELLPTREVTVNNSPALLSSFRSLIDNERIDLLIASQSFDVINIYHSKG